MWLSYKETLKCGIIDTELKDLKPNASNGAVVAKYNGEARNFGVCTLVRKMMSFRQSINVIALLG